MDVLDTLQNVIDQLEQVAVQGKKNVVSLGAAMLKLEKLKEKIATARAEGGEGGNKR